MARTRGRVDGNHGEIVRALNESGITTLSLAPMGHGCPDIIAGYRNINVLLEVKDGSKPPSARVLTAAEREFHETWGGQVAIVTGPEEAVIAVMIAAKNLGLV